MIIPVTVLSMCGVCYLIGGIPFGFLMGRLKGVDIRTAGSGNIGATNVGRTLGKGWGIACFLLDVAKGLAPTLVAGGMLAGRILEWGISPTLGNVLWLACGVCCVLGHNYPVYLRFRGGKGVATSLGVVLGVYPYLTVAGALAFGVWVVVALSTRYVSLGSMLAAASLPVFLALCTYWRGYRVFQANLPLLGFAILASGMVIYRHRANWTRLRAGTEPKLGGRA